MDGSAAATRPAPYVQYKFRQSKFPTVTGHLKVMKVSRDACEFARHAPHNCRISSASSSHIETLDGSREKKLEVTPGSLEEHWLFKIFGLCTLLPLMG